MGWTVGFERYFSLSNLEFHFPFHQPFVYLTVNETFTTGLLPIVKAINPFTISKPVSFGFYTTLEGIVANLSSIRCSCVLSINYFSF